MGGNFKEISVDEQVNELRENDAEFKKAWDAHITERLYKNLVSQYQMVIEAVLERYYYNMGADVYSTHIEARKDIISEVNKLKKQLRFYIELSGALGLALFVILLLIANLVF